MTPWVSTRQVASPRARSNLVRLLVAVTLRLRFRSAPVQQTAEELGDTVGLGEAGGLAARAK